MTQVEEKDDAVFHEIVPNSVELVIVKGEPRVEEYFVKCNMCKENFGSGNECVHLKNDGTDDSKQADKLQLVIFNAAVDMGINNSTEEMTPKVENTECSSSDKQEDSIVKMINTDVTVKQEEDVDSLEYLPSDDGFFGCETGQTKTEDRDMFYESIKIETIKEEPADNEASSNSDMLIRDKEGNEDIKPGSDNESSKDNGSQLYYRTEAVETNHHNQQKTYLSHFELHLSNQSKESQCKFCLKSFDHGCTCEHIHTREKPFDCKICSKRFFTKSNLVQHERTHTREKPFVCRVCLKNFYDRSMLARHNRIHTGEKPFDCKVCSKCFSTKYDLKTHERIHTGDKPFACKICSKRFFTRYILDQHEQIHTGEKLFDCKVCSKSFYNKSALVKHERIHTGEKPFDCNFCSKSFYHRCKLLRHERVHAGSDPLKHERVQTGEKPYKCKVCPKSFSTSSYCSKHEKTHTREKPIP